MAEQGSSVNRYLGDLITISHSSQWPMSAALHVYAAPVQMHLLRARGDATSATSGAEPADPSCHRLVADVSAGMEHPGRLQRCPC
jgi:hypothetical protein